MDRAVYLLGGGGHGRVVLDALLAASADVAGVLDPAITPGSSIFGVVVAGGDELLGEVDASRIAIANGVGANPSVVARARLFDELSGRGFTFTIVRHPSVVCALGCTLGEGAQLMAGVVLQTGVSIGANAVVNTRASVDHDTVIGRHAFVSPGAVLCGDVTVGDSAFVGAGAIVLPGRRIGAGAIVGAGSIVTRDVADGAVVRGNPAKRDTNRS
jgi:UDP-perosamine 4-acetyltransferase